MALSQGSQNQSRFQVEERFFDIQLGQTGGLLKEAIEEAPGVALTELAPGMWVGAKQLTQHTCIEVTARAQKEDNGTSVVLRVEHKTSGFATAAALLGLIVASCFLLPLIPILMWAQRTRDEQQRERLVLMHKLWTELGEVVGAPKRASYREAPARVYAPSAASPVRVQTPTDQGAAEAEAAEIEAAEAEAAARAAR